MTATAYDVKAIRRLAAHYIGSSSNPLTEVETKQFIAGTFTPSEEQLAALARLMQIPTRGKNHE